MKKYREFKEPNYLSFSNEVLAFWQENKIFEKSIKSREGSAEFIFYEGPPSANGLPGIHHVLSRTIKDIFCRYKTLCGYKVRRKAGWDTHGLPIEIEVEKKLNITKEDIGKKISITDYNNECRREVMKFKDKWDELTIKMGYWIDLENPYITFDNKYIESVWYLLKILYEKNLLYKGYSIQPYSPAAGTGLSTHELNQPGCYKLVKDNSVVAQFKVIRNNLSEKFFKDVFGDLYFLAWTTTPWTLPSNTALAVNSNIIYALVKTFNPYTYKPQTVILAEELIPNYFNAEDQNLSFEEYSPEKKRIPWQIIAKYPGAEFEGVQYEQLLPYVQPKNGKAFIVVSDDFVSIKEGTGIVHIAPSFGADDFRIAKKYGLGSLTLVDKQGRFVDEMGEFAKRFVKPEFEPNYDENNPSTPVDVDIITKLKKENKAFKAEKYEHSYPHCWRTDKPILYYPLDAWFIRTTAVKERMIELNKTILWKPEFTGSGRFGNWLENLVDWNLSRSRFWGIPLPIWATKDYSELKCIGSIEELYKEIEKSIEHGLMTHNPLKDFVLNDMSDENYKRIDLHRPYVDQIILVSSKGEPMYREPDLIDVWFDSGAMPYAQWHYPFENKEIFQASFPADFIAEGVDQTRGWFFTLHAIATMVSDSVAFKTVVSNGLVLDKNGNKMSKRLGNVVDPFKIIDTYGPDALRWYMISTVMPWENLKFDEDGVVETIRKFFNTLHNTYSFYALYANIDNFFYNEPDIDYHRRPELDRWILSELHSLIKRSKENYDNYEPTRVARDIQNFVVDLLSNWYVRLSRRRFWKSEYNEDKISAFQTLYQCLNTVAIIMSPIAPFYAEFLFKNLNDPTCKLNVESVHLTSFPQHNQSFIDKSLEEKMQLARQISSMVLSLRKRAGIRVRQPLSRIIIPLNNPHLKQHIEHVAEIIKTEVNIKNIEFVDLQNNFLKKTVKPNYKILGPKLGKQMKEVAYALSQLNQEQIAHLETNKYITLDLPQPINISIDEVEIITEDIPGWMIEIENNITVALDITITPQLRQEGIVREFINRIQNIRKEKNYLVTDKIRVYYEPITEIAETIESHKTYICKEVLAEELEPLKNNTQTIEIDIFDELFFKVAVEKIN